MPTQAARRTRRTRPIPAWQAAEPRPGTFPPSAVLAAVALVAALAGGCAGGSGGKAEGGDGAATAQAPTSTTLPQAGRGCVEPGDGAQPIRFEASNKASLAGVVLGSGPSGVVLAHQNGSDACQWMPYARELAKQGYQVLMFDFEGFGASPPRSGDAPILAVDTAGAVVALRSRGATKVVLVGASMGGTGALAAAGLVAPPVDGVVSLSAPAEFVGVDAKAAVATLDVPVLYVAAADDGQFGSDARDLHAATRSKDRKLLVVPGYSHGVGLLDDQDHGPKVRAQVEAFLRDHAG